MIASKELTMLERTRIQSTTTNYSKNIDYKLMDKYFCSNVHTLMIAALEHLGASLLFH